MFSVVRTKRYGSALAIAIKHGICTAVMVDEGENAEFASVKLIIGSKQIRLILTYGPQEYSSKQEIDDFYENINIQLNRALIAGESVVLAVDFNAKLRKDIIPQDIHDMSSNGKHLLNLINNFELVTMNSYEVCQGIFTRVNNKNCSERLVLDYLFVTTDLCSSISSMIIDEEKLYTPWCNLKKVKRYTDHNAIIFRLNIPTSHKKERKTNKHTVWNFNDMHGWNKFRQVTQDDKQLIDCWNASASFEACYQQWNNRLNYLIHTCFKKKRVVPRKRLYNREIRQLIRTRKKLKRNYNANDDNLCSPLKMLDKRIDNKIAQFNYDIMHNNVGHKPMSEQQFWKLKKTLAPKSISIPHSVMNSFGNEVTDPDKIVNEFRSEFQHRLRIREPQDHIKGYELLHNTLCDLRLQNCTAAKSPDFTVKGKGVVDNLFLLRGAIADCRYLGGELWLTFYDIEKCFDSLWLEDCINSLYENGVKDDILDLIYRLNQRAEIVVRTPFGDIDPFVVNNLVRQGTVLGPILNNCSLDQICKEGKSYQNGNIQLKPLEFVNDIAEPNDEHCKAQQSNLVISSILERKKLTFAAEKYKILKFGISKSQSSSQAIGNDNFEVVSNFRYLGDKFDSKGSYSVLCKTKAQKSMGTTTELISLCKEVKFGKEQIPNMIVLYYTLCSSPG